MTDRPVSSRSRTGTKPGPTANGVHPAAAASNGHHLPAGSVLATPLLREWSPQDLEPAARRNGEPVATPASKPVATPAGYAGPVATDPAETTAKRVQAKRAVAKRVPAKRVPAKPARPVDAMPVSAATRTGTRAATKTPAKTASTTPAKTAAKTASTTPAKTAAKTATTSPPEIPTDIPTPSRKATGSLAEAAAGRKRDVWDDRVAGALSFLRRRLTGQYEVDEFGFDAELTEVLVHPLLRLLYERYFRVEVSGVENLPNGAALLVANHSGTVPMDALMLSMAVHDETPARRYLRLLGADLVFRMPLLSELARKAGTTLACNPDAERLMRSGEYVGVFPEGFKGIGKPYRDRYKLQRFGRGGFVSAALRTSTPIVPVAIVGAEEIYPIVANIKPLARITGLPYLPITPLFPWFGPLGMLPLPSKWLIEFGTPIPTSQYVDDADDPIVVFNLADQVRETIQQTLHTLLERRPDPFS